MPDQEVRTAWFMNPEDSSKPIERKTNSEGKIVEVPTLTPKDETTKFLGWTTDKETNKLYNFAETPLTSDAYFYPVWEQRKTVVFHLGKKADESSTESETKTLKEVTETLYGFIGDVVSPSQTVINPSSYIEDTKLTYELKGWYDSSDKEKTLQTNVKIPETAVASKTIDLYPVWSTSLGSNDTLNETNLKAAMDELEKINNEDEDTLSAIINITEPITINNVIDVPKGLELHLNKNMTVGTSGKLTGDITKEEGITVVKSVNNSSSENIGDSLNNKNYDEVKLAAAVTSTSQIKVNEATEDATLDLAGFNLTLSSVSGSEGALLNNGHLTIKNSSAVATNGKIIAKSADTILNKGNITIEGGTFDNTSKQSEGKKAAFVNEGTATIKEGTFSRSLNETGSGAGYYVVINHGTLTINNGTFKTVSAKTATAALIENGYYTSAETVGKSEAKLTIEGGTFEGGRYIVKNDYAGVATITGGKYTAVPSTETNIGDNTKTNETRSIFKTIGEMTLDFTKATSENTEINLGNNSKTALVLVGDQKITSAESVTNNVIKNKVTVYPFNSELVKLNNKALSDASNSENSIKQLIVVEKGKDQLEKAEIEIHVGGNGISAKDASKQLMLLMREFVAKEMNKENSEKTTVRIVLDSNVEILEDEETEQGYQITKENTELDLNGNILTIHKLYVFEVNAKVTDTSKDKKGKIVLNSTRTQNEDKDIFSNGELLPLDELKAIADEEIAAEE